MRTDYWTVLIRRDFDIWLGDMLASAAVLRVHIGDDGQRPNVTPECVCADEVSDPAIPCTGAGSSEREIDRSLEWFEVPVG